MMRKSLIEIYKNLNKATHSIVGRYGIINLKEYKDFESRLSNKHSSIKDKDILKKINSLAIICKNPEYHYLKK